MEFNQAIEDDHKHKLVLPSTDFQRLCVEQLDLFRRIVDPNALLSVYVRPAGSYVMDRLELRRVMSYPPVNATDIVVLVGNFRVPTGLRTAEAALSSQEVQVVYEHRAVVFPMVKQPFVVGFLVAELPEMEACGNLKGGEGYLANYPTPEEAYSLPQSSGAKSWDIRSIDNDASKMNIFTAAEKLNAINISRSLAMAYVMDQTALLLQQSSWQNNVRMSALVEQIHGPLASIRALSRMLSTHTKNSEISHDLVEDILVQGEQMKDTLQELQRAVLLTKTNMMRYNEETLRRINSSSYVHPDSKKAQMSSDFGDSDVKLSLGTTDNDLEMPMPPLALTPLRQEIRPCNVSGLLADLVEAVKPLARKQKRTVELSDLSQSLRAAIEEPALRQALSNLIEGALLRTNVGGKVEIVCAQAPASGTLVLVDDDGPDMHYMTQMHSLAPFGSELFSENRVEDNMTWNFVAGLAIAREILEGYGCVVRVISPRRPDAALGAGGTRIELWLPSFSDELPETNSLAQEE